MSRRTPEPAGQTRREMLAASVLAMAGLDVLPPELVASPRHGGLGTTPADEGITAATVAEAEKIHAVSFGSEAHAAIAKALPAQVAAIKAARAAPVPREMPPAIIFDPRLPGRHYPRQPNRVVLARQVPRPLPTDEADIAFAPVTDLAAWLKARQLTSRRLTEIYLARIRRIAPRLYCFITVTDQLALEEADRADREIAAGRYRGPLHGVPYGIKDVFDTKGIVTTWGATPFKDRIPEHDAAIVTRLRDAGAVLLGKLATGALANGATWFGGQCRNPWNPEEPAGGSSTGSGSATAAGLCGFAIGTDSLGSILNPADRCGITGLRPTFGRVPTAGAMPLTPSLDRIGPLCRGVEDAAVVLAAIAGPDPTSPTSIDLGFQYDAAIDLRRVVVGYSPAWFEQVGFGPGASVPASRAHHDALAALRGLGVKVIEVDLPARPSFALINNLMVEAAAVFEDLTLSGRDRELPEDNGTAWPQSWRQIRFISAVDYLQLERLRRQLMLDMGELFDRVDAVFGPTYGNFDLLLRTNFTGHPGLTMRAGLSTSPTRGLGAVPLDPTGPPQTITQNVTFHGRLFQEGTLIALGRALETRLKVASHRPAL